MKQNKNIVFVSEHQYLFFYQPLAKQLHKKGFNPILIYTDPDENWKDSWPYYCVPASSLIEKLTQKQSTDTITSLKIDPNKVTIFEQSYLKNPALFKKSYQYTCKHVTSHNNAIHLANSWAEITIEAIKLWQPHAIFIWNGRYLPYKAISETCLKLNFPFYTNEIAWIPGTIFIDQGPLNMSTNPLKKSKAMLSDQEADSVAKNFLRDYTNAQATMVEQKTIEPSALRKKFLSDKYSFLLFYGCQVDWDTNIVIGANRFNSNKDVIDFLVRAVKKHPHIKLVVKLHPLDTIDQTQELKKALGSHGEIVSNIHAHSLIKAADCVVVRNSTLGFEAICYEKPLILLEQAKYNNPDLVYSPKTESELNAIFDKLISKKHKALPQKQALSRFIAHLLTNYLLPLKYRYFFSKKALQLQTHLSQNTALENLCEQLQDNKKSITTKIENNTIKNFLQTNRSKNSIMLQKIKQSIKKLNLIHLKKPLRFLLKKIRVKRLKSRTIPISKTFGIDRGEPIDRYYIEKFLLQNEPFIRGHILEVADNSYTKKYGKDKVTKSEILHLTGEHSNATIIADLTKAEHIPSNQFDCIILTQTLQFIYDKKAAMKNLYRILKPGGTLLATASGISQISNYDMERWGEYWRFTTLSAQKLFEECFPTTSISVQSHGNVLTAISFLHGLAAHEIKKEKLDYNDPNYQVIITIKATKPLDKPAEKNNEHTRNLSN